MSRDEELKDVVFSTGVDYLGWDAVEISRGPVSLFLTPQIGGRIMGIRFEGQDLCYVHPDKKGQAPTRSDRFDIEQWRKELGFPLWGGGKTWISPQSAFPESAPHPDLDSGPYRFEIQSLNRERVDIVMKSGVCRDSKIRIRRRLSMDFTDAAWTVEHSIENRGDHSWTGGIWDVLMLQKPATVYAPVYQDGVHVFENGSQDEAGLRALKPSDLSDRYSQIECREDEEFKLGLRLKSGWMAAHLPGNIGYLRFFDYCRLSTHAHGWPGEVYNSGKHPYFEIESHSPQVTLPPRGTAKFKVIEQVGRWDSLLDQIKAGDVGYEFG